MNLIYILLKSKLIKMKVIISFTCLFILNIIVSCYTIYNNKSHYDRLILTMTIKKNMNLFIINVILTSIIEEIIFTNYIYSFIGPFLGCILFGIYHIPMILISNNKLSIDYKLNLLAIKIMFAIIGGFHLYIIMKQYSLLHSILYHILYNILSEYLIYIKISSSR